ncbi:methionyl-tRNA formyltransferase [Desertimonas flava]|jgi:methionyl-tRNA formyltransferase|uniref:methionyl-tRNA formyltransferase n=1 Tax=Desertimonas flava TaxID=2064846 RepID=UPI000E34577C|nr:methionyl-tRNA formyltransferase [Desertimonas flava]
MASRRIVFLGTPEMAVPPLRALHAAGHEIALVVSQPDRRRGRGGATSPSPVKAAALELGLPVTDRVDDIVDLAADAPVDLGVVVAFGRLIKAHVLDAVPMVNVHFSLLPRWRGAAPVERALLAGDTETGVCIMDVEETLDTGAVYASETVAIGADTTAEQLRTELVTVGTRLLVDVLAADPLPVPVPQLGEPTYAAKIDPGEWRIDWTQPAETVHRWVRAGHAWTTFRGKRLRILSAELTTSPSVGGAGTLQDGVIVAAGGAVRPVTVQPEGKGPMAWAAFANGARPAPGERFGD